MIRPKFTSRKNRTTIREEEERMKNLNIRLSRDKEFRDEISKRNRLELEIELSNENDQRDQEYIFNDEDDNNAADQYRMWEIRELKRLKQEYLEYNINSETTNNMSDLELEYVKDKNINLENKSLYKGPFFKNSD